MISLLCPKALGQQKFIKRNLSDLVRSGNETWPSDFCLGSAVSDWTSTYFKDGRREIHFNLKLNVLSNKKSIFLLSKFWL